MNPERYAQPNIASNELFLIDDLSMDNPRIQAFRHIPVPKSKQFSEWFGPSKIKNTLYMPRVVFHGTLSTDFSRFDITKSEDVGFHFGSIEQVIFRVRSKARKAGVTHARIIPCFLSIHNPLEIGDKMEWDDTFVLCWLHEKKLVKSYEKYMKIRHSVVHTGLDIYMRDSNEMNLPGEVALRNADIASFARVRQWYDLFHIDGLRYKNEFEGRGYSYVAFRPNQIKSALINTGSFNPTDDNIYQ